MRDRLLVFVSVFLIGVTIVSIGGGIIILRRRASPIQTISTAEVGRDKATSKGAPSVWSDFANLPVVDDCKLHTFQSCVPSVLYSKVNGEQLIVKTPADGNLNLFTMRSIILAEDKYLSSFLMISKKNPDDLLIMPVINNSAVSGINPLITAEIIRISLDQPNGATQSAKTAGQSPIDAQVFGQQVPPAYVNSYAVETLGEQVPSELASESALFSLPEQAISQSPIFANNESQKDAILGLAKVKTFTPLQKAIIKYFYDNLTEEAYRGFVNSINALLSFNVGSFPLERTASSFNSTTSEGRGLRFCNPSSNSSEVLRCVKGMGKYSCTAEDSRKICFSQYILNITP